MVEPASRKYILKLYDKELASIRVSRNALGLVGVEMLDRDENARFLFPMEMVSSFDSDGARRWIEGRVIPRNREFVDKIFLAAGLEIGDTIGVLDVCKGLSVNDSYWLDTEASGLTWEEVNLFKNDLDETLALVAYTGYTASQKHAIGLSSEWTSSGQFAKAWRRIDGRLVLYKAGSEGFANAGLEPYSEYFASQIADAMGISHVEYGLDRWKGRLASTCGIMNSADVSFVDFWAATGTTVFPESLALGLEFSEDAFEDMRDMLVFDALICNDDRHGKNFGFLRDNTSGGVICLAPLFDHNFALFSRDMGHELAYLEERAENAHFPRGTTLTFSQQAAAVMGRRQHEKLRRLLGFGLEDHPTHRIDPARLSALDRYLQDRVRRLLEIPVVNESTLRSSLRESLPKDGRTVPLLSCGRAAPSQACGSAGKEMPALAPRRQRGR